MENTANCGPQSSKRKSLPSRPAVGEASASLVYTRISQQSTVESLEIYPRSVKVVRQKYKGCRDNVPPVRTEITGFSDSSRRRLRHTAGNAADVLISQLGLTYHMKTPDGREAKKDINSFLTRLRYKFPDIQYLWIAEFQKRGVLHFHLFSSLPHDQSGTQKILATMWNKIAEPGNKEHLWWHMRNKQGDSNFIKWDMSSPGYLCKYLDKQAQKCIPDGFKGMGRFWGCTRDLVKMEMRINPEDVRHLIPEAVDYETGEINSPDAFQFIVRNIGKLHEKQIKEMQKKTDKKLWKSRVRNGMTSYTLQSAAPQFRQIFSYLRKQFQKETNLPF